MTRSVSEFSWVGSQVDYVDEITIDHISHLTLGRFGGNSRAGQYKNEDGCLIWADETGSWELVVLLDAHYSAESAELVIHQFLTYKAEIQALLAKPFAQTFKGIEETILRMFQEEEFLSECLRVKGETACLVLLRKNMYLWWFSIGDCLSYLFHPELAQLGQFQINQRQFYEWVGNVNTFGLDVPCYSSGIRELRKGVNRILVTTDGLVECPGEPYSDAKEIYNILLQHPGGGECIMALLNTIREHGVRDSTTIISWEVSVSEDVQMPSDG
ncbi:protein phosphatase 2C domain-containing protein [Rossellomorea aquimaris]|uniref:protein phosphatase 2C domain-containing protein n=1 Tax=Rossellomorea aquimaris TaxID=189382 RepID=UPI001CFEDEA4|nr:protein phosphatase 2C domain-containing protein [Rossellomorea aquimaris]